MEEDKKEISKEYTNGEVTIVWKPDKCFHATFCWREAPE
ncbi:MAG: (4Fe-4S)-binding protein, partial [Prevotellaceae bacterium]|nr:(4Fe-4S)-binding protein [Prevotellaceae bacterium]